jgi:hypothetical protein
VIARGIKEFLSRDWQASREAKDAYWGDRIARLGPEEGLRIAGELWRQARVQDPRWPHPDDRRQDLLAHIRVVHLLRHASTTRRR